MCRLILTREFMFISPAYCNLEHLQSLNDYHIHILPITILPITYYHIHILITLPYLTLNNKATQVLALNPPLTSYITF